MWLCVKRNAHDRQRIADHRGGGARPMGGLWLAGAALCAGLLASSASSQPPQERQIGPRVTGAPPGSKPAPSDPRDLSGVWWKSFTPGLHPADGGPTPLQPWSAKIQADYLHADEIGKPLPDATTLCLPMGIPRVMLAPYPIQVLQTKGLVTILFEASHNVRFIYLDVPHTPNLKPSYMGESVGHWEGNTLVVDTIGQNDKTLLDRNGLVHSDQLHVVERMRKVKDKAGHDQLEDEMTIEDPKTYTKPWIARIALEWRPDTQVEEAVCEENNKDAFNIQNRK